MWLPKRYLSVALVIVLLSIATVCWQRLSIVPSFEDCLRRRLVAVWIPGILGIPVSVETSWGILEGSLLPATRIMMVVGWSSAMDHFTLVAGKLFFGNCTFMYFSFALWFLVEMRSWNLCTHNMCASWLTSWGWWSNARATKSSFRFAFHVFASLILIIHELPRFSEVGTSYLGSCWTKNGP